MLPNQNHATKYRTTPKHTDEINCMIANLTRLLLRSRQSSHKLHCRQGTTIAASNSKKLATGSPVLSCHLLQTYFPTYCENIAGLVPGGGHSHWKGVWGCAAVMTPFFQASRRSLAHQFTLNVPLLCPPVFNFQNIFAFSTMFWPKF